MNGWSVLFFGGLLAFGAVLYRAGRAAAWSKAYQAKEEENEKVDESLRRSSDLSRGECLERLRGRSGKR